MAKLVKRNQRKTINGGTLPELIVSGNRQTVDPALKDTILKAATQNYYDNIATPLPAGNYYADGTDRSNFVVPDEVKDRIAALAKANFPGYANVVTGEIDPTTSNLVTNYYDNLRKIGWAPLAQR